MRPRRAVPYNSALLIHSSTSYKVPYILPSSVCSKSFVSHSYENCRGVPSFFPIRVNIHLPWCPASVPRLLRYACGDSALFHESPARPVRSVGVTNHLPPVTASARKDSSRFHQSPARPVRSVGVTNHQSLTHSESTLARHPISVHFKGLRRGTNSCRINTYEKTRGGPPRTRP
jgi:hypothetical protein